MSAWPGKYVIGLTGNIATGKSVVRKMLEHLGAYGIDADALSHRAIAKGAPGYRHVVATFGEWVLAPDGQIDRQKLGRLVFANPDAMAKLEEIVHPLVRAAVDVLARRAEQPVLVIEAIKLLEGELKDACDTIWVTYAPPEIQYARLIKKRKMSPEEAKQRIQIQGAQEEKLEQAHVIIENSGAFEETWRQVVTAWRTLVPVKPLAPKPVKRGVEGVLEVHRGHPQEADEIARFITEGSGGKITMSRSDVMAAFGEQAYLLLKSKGKIVGIMGWQIENLVTRVINVFVRPDIPLAPAMKSLIAEVEKASKELQAEASLLFLPPSLAQHQEIWQSLGYVTRTVKELRVRAWQDAAMESMPPGTVLYFKQLRKDRVLRPV